MFLDDDKDKTSLLCSSVPEQNSLTILDSITSDLCEEQWKGQRGISLFLETKQIPWFTLLFSPYESLPESQRRFKSVEADFSAKYTLK